MARILIVDDDAQMRNMLQLMLERLGHETTQASDGREGVAAHQDAPFELVITDILMPGGEGLETIQDLRRVHPEVKIIAISGGGRTGALDFLDVAEKLGAHRTLQKPFGLDDLTQAVETLLSPG